MLICGTLMAQDVKDMQSSNIGAQRAAFITEQLDLTQKEAEVFFPIYNAYNKELRSLRIRPKDELSPDEMNDQQAEQRLEYLLGLEEKKVLIKRKYKDEMKSVISNKKILQLFMAEREFKKNVLQRFKKRRRMRKN